MARNTRKSSLEVLVFVAASAVFGAQAAEIRPLVKAGVDFGGDTMVTAVFSDGFTEEVRANDGFYIGGGAVIIDNARNMEYHLTLAYKFASIDGTDGDIEWSRIPLEALAFYRFSRVRLGGGLTYHINPRLEGDGSAGGLDVDFKNALGVVLQADWRVNQMIGVGARYTILEYDAEGAFFGSAKSNGVGVTLSINF